MKTIHIQDRDLIGNDKIQNKGTTGHDYWIDSDAHGQVLEKETGRDDIKFYAQNFDANVDLGYGRNYAINGFFASFYMAYNRHGSVILSPDDIWIMVCLNFSLYVTKYAEELRHLFVNHGGRKTLTVLGDFDQGYDLTYMADKFTKRIKEETKGAITETLEANFSTSGPLEKLLSSIAIMDTMKSYFKYSMACICGITDAHMMGSLEDWQRLREKLQALRAYHVENSGWEAYVDGLLPVIDQFIKTYQGQVDVAFWNDVVQRRERTGGAYTPDNGQISGWLLKFYYGFSGENVSDLSKIPHLQFRVEVELRNGLSDVMGTPMLIYGGFSGLACHNNAYRPQLSTALIHSTKQNQMASQLTKHYQSLYGDQATQELRNVGFKLLRADPMEQQRILAEQLAKKPTPPAPTIRPFNQAKAGINNLLDEDTDSDSSDDDSDSDSEEEEKATPQPPVHAQLSIEDYLSKLINESP